MDQNRWRKSSYSGDESACVEASRTLDALRDSKNPEPELPAPGLPDLIRLLKSAPADLPNVT
ncbi:DUF397 domain-containing protein [Actinokineospora xionganensis]|uniref:DUF397 domain-containing protein n=1 Tax=Actinokineospora xionganensis TaxID=2684470 RepID=A0ABR7LHC3_9PSEU|nr:DUF397 domain-containing protein [Actinokineospora xionganensis]MBC6451687.1 DUF397 domain-containing protein [Actinokineospora xionganensis]